MIERVRVIGAGGRVGSAVSARLAERGPSGQVVQMETGWANEAESEIDRLFAEE